MEKTAAFANKALRQMLEKLRPIDDALFEALIRDPEVCQEILRVILSDDKLIVEKVVPQYSIKNLYGRSVRLDAYCILGCGKHVNIEVQRANNDDHLRRMWFNAACIVAQIAEPGEKFEKIPDVISVFISEFDYFEDGDCVNYIGHVVRKTGERINCGWERIHVCANVKDGSLTSKLMECFLQTQVDNSKFPKLSDRMTAIKQGKGGDKKMYDRLRELAEPYAKQYAAECVDETKREMAYEFFKNGAPYEVVHRSISAISEEELREIQKKACKLA